GRHLSRARRLLGACGGTPSGHHPTSARRSCRVDRLEGGFVRRPLLSTRAAGIFLGYGADRWLGDPRRFHPVAAFGSAATALEQRLYSDSRARGLTHVVFLVGAATGLGIIAERVTARAPIARTAVTAVATWGELGAPSRGRARWSFPGTGGGRCTGAVGAGGPSRRPATAQVSGGSGYQCVGHCRGVPCRGRVGGGEYGRRGRCTPSLGCGRRGSRPVGPP